MERALAHTIKEKGQAAYARSDRQEKRRPLMVAWGQWCLCEPAAAEVRSLALKFCGLDLATRQSGQFRGKAKLSKHGNARLRLTLWMAAQVAIRQPGERLPRQVRVHQIQADIGHERRFIGHWRAPWSNGEPVPGQKRNTFLNPRGSGRKEPRRNSGASASARAYIIPHMSLFGDRAPTAIAHAPLIPVRLHPG